MAVLRDVAMKYNPRGKNIEHNYVQAWVGAIVLKEGIKRAGRNLNEDSLISAIESIKDFDTEGISGLISFSSDNHKGGEYSRLLKADTEKKFFLPITEWRKPAR